MMQRLSDADYKFENAETKAKMREKNVKEVIENSLKLKEDLVNISEIFSKQLGQVSNDINK